MCTCQPRDGERKHMLLPHACGAMIGGGTAWDMQHTRAWHQSGRRGEDQGAPGLDDNQATSRSIRSHWLWPHYAQRLMHIPGSHHMHSPSCTSHALSCSVSSTSRGLITCTVSHAVPYAHPMHSVSSHAQSLTRIPCTVMLSLMHIPGSHPMHSVSSHAQSLTRIPCTVSHAVPHAHPMHSASCTSRRALGRVWQHLGWARAEQASWRG